MDRSVSEQELREDVALANRIIERFGLSNAFGHVSARLPGTNRFLFPTRASPALAEADRLLVLDTDGNILSGEGRPNTEFWIHARIYAARPDVGAVVHAHPPACVALAQIGEPLKVLYNNAAVFSDGIPIYERIGLIRSRELGDQLAERLGKNRAVLMRGHGLAVAEPDVRLATVIAFFLEEAADLQLRMLAAAGGDSSRLRVYTQEEARLVREQIDNSGPLARAWEYFVFRLSSPQR